jgi:hypothetical protein
MVGPHKSRRCARCATILARPVSPGKSCTLRPPRQPARHLAKMASRLASCKSVPYRNIRPPRQGFDDPSCPPPTLLSGKPTQRSTGATAHGVLEQIAPVWGESKASGKSKIKSLQSKIPFCSTPNAAGLQRATRQNRRDTCRDALRAQGTAKMEVGFTMRPS